MVDFHQWLEESVGIKLDLRSVALGGTLRMEFQRSDFNKEQRAARRAERAAGRQADEEEEEAPAKAATKPKPAPPKGRAASTKTPAPKAPAKRTRASAGAPF